jgi:hypothetical protein
MNPKCHDFSMKWQTCTHIGCMVDSSSTRCTTHKSANPKLALATNNNLMPGHCREHKNGQERLVVIHHGFENAGTKVKCKMSGTRADKFRACSCVCANKWSDRLTTQGPTASPTPFPTRAKTATPTSAPTLAPTRKITWACDTSKNWINGMRYSQIQLTDSCKNGVCDANPKYGAPMTAGRATTYCKKQCAARSSCTGFFFQKHTNGHEICGFYTKQVNMNSLSRHGHKYGAVCTATGYNTASPTYAPTLAPTKFHLTRKPTASPTRAPTQIVCPGGKYMYTSPTTKKTFCVGFPGNCPSGKYTYKSPSSKKKFCVATPTCAKGKSLFKTHAGNMICVGTAVKSAKVCNGPCYAAWSTPWSRKCVTGYAHGCDGCSECSAAVISSKSGKRGATGVPPTPKPPACNGPCYAAWSTPWSRKCVSGYAHGCEACSECKGVISAISGKRGA